MATDRMNDQTTLPGGLRSRPTMREVAALAEVSIKTVSRVVNGEAGVTAEMTARVQRAVEQLDYRHDFAASALRRSDRRSATIGMVLEDLANPFSAAVQRSVEDVARERGVLVLAGSSDEDPVREHTLVATFTARRVDGLVIMPAGMDHSLLNNERRSGTPIVFIDRPPRFLDADTVLVDNSAGVRNGVAHLARRGHRRIAFLGDRQRIYTAQERYAGYRLELEAQGIAFDDELVAVDLHGMHDAVAAVHRLLAGADAPTAIFAAQNLLTIGAVVALRQLHAHRRVAVVGFDDILLADLLDPAITVVAQDPPAIGRAAAELLFARLDGDRSPTQRRILPTRLIERGSGEIGR